MNTKFSIYSDGIPEGKPSDLVIVPCYVNEPETMTAVEGVIFGEVREDTVQLLNKRGPNGELRCALVFLSRFAMTSKSICAAFASAVEIADCHDCARVIVPVEQFLNKLLPPIMVSTIMHCAICQLRMRGHLTHIEEVVLTAPAGMLSAIGYGLQMPAPLCRLCTLPE